MLRGDKLRSQRSHPNVVKLVAAALDHQTGTDQEASLDKIQELIPAIKELGIWGGGNTRDSARALAVMVAGLEGKRVL